VKLRWQKWCCSRVSASVVVLASLSGLTAAVPANGEDIYYCGYVITQGQCTFEPDGYAISSDVNRNNSYVPGSDHGAVCERAYWNYNGSTVSRRCASGGYVASDYYYCDGDLWPWQGSSLELTASNNQSLAEKIDGHTYVEDECT
jgi:hypothetical protein